MKGFVTMRGLKEFVLSFTLALITIFVYYGLGQSVVKAHGRFQNPAEPIASNGASVDEHLAMNWGQEEVHARAAWTRHKGSKDVIVAVIDTGCDVHHPDLQANIWRNPGEDGLDEYGNPKANNGIDDDDNGFVDDFHGWNFVDQNGDVADEHGHGTHIAGIIGSANGVAPNVSLMILK